MLRVVHWNPSTLMNGQENVGSNPRSWSWEHLDLVLLWTRDWLEECDCLRDTVWIIRTLFRSRAVFHSPGKRIVVTWNDVTPEVTAQTGPKNKMDASRKTFVVLALSEYKHIKKVVFFTCNAEISSGIIYKFKNISIYKYLYINISLKMWHYWCETLEKHWHSVYIGCEQSIVFCQSK